MKVYTNRYILTPGPTEVPHRVRLALSRETTNPDLDEDFMKTYNEVRAILRNMLGVYKGSLYVLVGEAMLGLDAALANTVRRGTKVLVIGNGVYGEGFADLVRLHGGEPILVENCEECWRRSADAAAVEDALDKHPEIEVVTLVHCDTPSGLLNDLSELSKAVRKRGALLIVDAVSSIGGVPIDFDALGIDILIGGSQKAFNVPSGLTIVAISERGWERIKEVNYGGFYLNLNLWREMLDERGVFPYTMSDVLIYALHESLKSIIEEGLENAYKRHLLARKAAWKALESLKLSPFVRSIQYSSPTVTAFEPPEGIKEAEIREVAWRKYGVMLAGSWGKLQGRVMRIGHMGFLASRSHLIIAFSTLARALSDLGYKADTGEAIEAIEESFRD